MKNRKTYHFNRLKDQLPVHDAPESIWENINIHFTNREQEDKFISDNKPLPVHEPGDEVWENIEQKLKKDGKVFRFKKVIFLKIAATILIAAGISILLTLFDGSGKYRFYYSSETEESAIDFMDQPIETNDLSMLIENICSDKPALCESKIYIELNSEIKKLESEKQEIIRSYEENKSEQLLNYLYFIENQKVEIQKKILQYSNQI